VCMCRCGVIVGAGMWLGVGVGVGVISKRGTKGCGLTSVIMFVSVPFLGLGSCMCTRRPLGKYRHFSFGGCHDLYGAKCMLTLIPDNCVECMSLMNTYKYMHTRTYTHTHTCMLTH